MRQQLTSIQPPPQTLLPTIKPIRKIRIMSRLGMHLPPRIYHRSGFVLLDRIFWGRQNLRKRLRFGLRIPWRLVPVRFGVRKVLIRQVRSEDLGGD